MKSVGLVLLHLVLWVEPHAALAGSIEDDVRVLQADVRNVVIEYRPAFSPPRTIHAGGREFVRYEFWSNVADPTCPVGSPEVLSRIVLLRFPGIENNTVEVLTIDYEEVPSVMLAPAPELRKSDVGPSLAYVPNPSAYAVAEWTPSIVASLSPVRGSNGLFFADLILNPYQYNAATQTLRKYSRIIVRVNYGTEAVPVQGSRVGRGAALNDDVIVPTEGTAALSKPAAIRSSVLSTGVWYRFPVTEEGIYKLMGQTLLDAGVPSSTDPRTIKIYGNGGYEVPMAPTARYDDDLLENAILLSDEVNPGQLDPSDYIVFHGKTTRGWNYNSRNKMFSHYINHFAETNVYWLTYDGEQSRAMELVPSLTDPAPFRPTTVNGMLFREDERTNFFSSGIEWIGQAFNPNDKITYVHPLPGLDHSQPITYRFSFNAFSMSPSTFSVYEHGSTLVDGTVPATYGFDYLPLMSGSATASQVPSFSDDQSQLRIEYKTGSSDGRGYINSYEIIYKRFLTAQNDAISFFTPDTDAVMQFDVSGFSGAPVLVFDVTKFDSVVQITNTQFSGDVCSFQVSPTADNVRQLCVVGPGGFKPQGAMTRVNNQNLHGETTEAEYIIITHADFMQAAQRLKAYRERPGDNYLRTLVVDVAQIYNEFGGGLFTPVAIRNYLRYVYSNWTQRPRYVLLFGDGDFDYKRALGVSNPNWIPPWESVESFQPLSTYASEDDFITFSASGRVDSIGLGRLTARTLSDANTMVDKIIEYETSPVIDPWKLRTTFVADDGLEAPRRNNYFSHKDDAESIARIVPPLFEKRKIYLHAYPTEYTPSGRRKPAVNRAIRDQIGQGTLLLNFNGHGNPRVWTHEAVFVRETDLPMLRNKGKYFFLVAATCNYSHFDKIAEESGGELLVSMRDAGAIAVFSANRPVFQGQNRDLNELLYRQLLRTDSLGRVIPERLGDVIFRTKRLGTGGENDRKYFLAGDPALRIAFPQFYVSVDSINGQAASTVTQLQALSRASIKASVHDQSIAVPSAFTGTALTLVYDSDKRIEIEDFIERKSPLPPLRITSSYTTAGGILFRGEQSVTNGLLTANFIVPKDISYGNANGRISLYCWNGTSDGAGYTTNIQIGGTDSTAVPDTKGPSIRLYVDDRGFRSGDVVSESPLLIADLFDSSGINTSGSGVGHRLEAWLDDRGESSDLSEYYKSKTDTYQEGTVEYPLGTLSPGTHKLRLRAWDTYNNSSMVETVFDVMVGVGLQLANVFNYPNPFGTATVFSFEHNQVSSIDAEVKIYTVAGRLIKSLRQTGVNRRVVHIPWDGLDTDGDPIANGIYLYKVVARTSDGRLASEAFGKLSVAK